MKEKKPFFSQELKFQNRKNVSDAFKQLDSVFKGAFITVYKRCLAYTALFFPHCWTCFHATLQSQPEAPQNMGLTGPLSAHRLLRTFYVCPSHDPESAWPEIQLNKLLSFSIKSPQISAGHPPSYLSQHCRNKHSCNDKFP